MRRSRESMARHREAMVEYQQRGAEVFDLRQLTATRRVSVASRARSPTPGSSPHTSAISSAKGRGPFGGSRLSGDPEDIARTDARCSSCFRITTGCTAGSAWPGSACSSRGFLRGSAGSAPGSDTLPAFDSTTWCAAASSRHLWSSARPSRQWLVAVPAARDRGDARRQRRHRRLAGAQRAAEHRERGNVGRRPPWWRRRHGLSIHAGAQVCADGTELSARRCELVLTNDPSTGVMRHADAGYPEARDAARERGVRVPCSTWVRRARERSRVARRRRGHARPGGAGRADRQGVDHTGRVMSTRRRSGAAWSASPPGTRRGTSTSRSCA